MQSPRFSSAHAALGDTFFDAVEPARFPHTILRYRNGRWAERVGLADLSDAEWLRRFGRFEPFADSFAQPLALRYHGHQFRSYNPDLGDGRGFLFAQLHDLADGRLLDLATKGSGRTPWSRGGDGRLTLKGGVREVLATALLEAAGVDTSKSFSLVETGEQLVRGDEPSPTRAAVLVRLSHSHIRIGTFQRLAYHGDTEALALLRDHTVRTYMPAAWRDDDAERTVAFLDVVCGNVARLAAQWLAAGFVHGVLNTDNINVTGESFDYGPWRFLPHYDPAFTAAYFDETGLYAFGRQPDAVAWNLTRLAECLVPLASAEALEPVLNRYWPRFQVELPSAVLWRLGLQPAGAEADAALVSAVFSFLLATSAPYEQFFFDWRGGSLSVERAARSPAADFYARPEFVAVADALEARAATPGVNLEHPYFARSTPRTLLLDEVEAIWEPIAVRDDWSALASTLLEIEQMRQAYFGQ